jgi:hypothetical protein
MIRVTSDHPKIHRHPRLTAAIAGEIMELQQARAATHDKFARRAIDAKIKRLFALMQKVATAALLAILIMPPPVAAQARGACSAYMSADTCLRAISRETRFCLTAIRPPSRDPAYGDTEASGIEVLQCLNAAVSKTGGAPLEGLQ